MTARPTPTESEDPMTSPAHPAWLPEAVFRPLGRRRVAVLAGDDPVSCTVRTEVDRATAVHGGELVADPDPARGADCAPGAPGAPGAGLVLEVVPGHADPEAFTLRRCRGRAHVTATGPAGLLYGLHHVVRLGEPAFDPSADDRVEHAPREPVRMLDHWDNMSVHPSMGQVERGYAGGSLFYADGAVRADLTRVAQYARLLGSIGINRVGLNNVNVHEREAHLLTDGLPDVARLADVFRPHGIRVHLSVAFSAPMLLGGLPTADPLDPGVRRWWAQAADRVYATVPDFGGFVVKADSEGQPGPFSDGRDHADGANVLAEALARHGGTVFWRAFVYDHRQDWRDRSTDRARAAHDHFAPLDGRFADNVVLQVKHGPMDFQVREPVSPVIAAMPTTRLAVELQVTQEYTGQQRHVCYLAPAWSQALAFRPWGEGATVADIAAGAGPGGRPGGLVAVSNVGDDVFWTGHPLAQANLFAFGRLAWDPTLRPTALLDEWIPSTFGRDEVVSTALHALMDDSWHTYESYTAPLGVGFMVRPGHHYGPDVDGYEYTPWGTYHFADHDGIGVDRTRATGTGYTGQYPAPWREVYESVDTCPDELLLFFHHVPYDHVLRSGTTVVQHIYDSRAAGALRVEQLVRTWQAVHGRVDEAVHARVTERLAEQLRSAGEWRDQVRSYFFRKSGVPDASQRPIY